MINTENNFATFISQNLNTEQQQAVAHKQGSLLVVAGAGSGKTRVITARITNLILHEGVMPGSIVALTFTNKAAKEMQERVASFLGTRRELPFIGTFHAYCLRILKHNRDRMTHPFISIMDTDDQHTLLSSILTRYNLKKQISVQQIAAYISHHKNQSLDARDFNQTSYGQHPLMLELYATYEHEKRTSKCLDFDDLLVETVQLFKKNPDFKALFHEHIRHILVDEYQDTNVVQHELLQQMAKADNLMCVDSLCVVGDEDQSIYSWRGATVANIMNFKKDFAPTTVIKLERNYRSVQPILDIANHIIKYNRNRTPKSLWSERAGNNCTQQILCLSDHQEGETIAAFLKEIALTQKLSDTAILYRTHFQSRALEETLIRNSIPYTIIGGIQFYERKEIKDLLAYMRLMVNPFDRTSFFRVVNCPTRSLGEKFEELFFEHWQQQPFLSFSDLSKKLIDEGAIVGAKKSSLLSFVSIFDSRTANDSPKESLEHIINATNYLQHLKKSYGQEEAQERIENVKELLRSVAHLESQQQSSVQLFLEEVTLMQEHRKNKNTGDPVLLMTLHAAKGLEFKNVVLVGLEEGLLPSSRSLIDNEKLEEERRLFYVGITRAEERLLLTFSRYRSTYGNTSTQTRSRFLDEIPKELLPTHDLSKSLPAQIKQFFAQWLSPATQEKQPSSVLTFGTNSVKKVPKKSASSTSTENAWKKNQLVHHATFGIGIIKNVEHKTGGTTSVEVSFKEGTKKIAHTFLKPVAQ